jgi:hypothetical protein
LQNEIAAGSRAPAFTNCAGQPVQAMSALPPNLLLFSGALEQFDGSVKPTFAKQGLICKLSLVLQESSPSVTPDVTTTTPKMFAAD